MFRPVSWASCSRICRVGLGVALNEAFNTSNCFAFIVVLGPLRLLPAFPPSVPSLLLLLSLVSILEQLLPGLMLEMIWESGERGLGQESDKWSMGSSLMWPGLPGEFERSDLFNIGWWLFNNGFSLFGFIIGTFCKSAVDLVSKWSLSRGKSLSDKLSWCSRTFSKSPSSSISEPEIQIEKSVNPFKLEWIHPSGLIHKLGAVHSMYWGVTGYIFKIKLYFFLFRTNSVVTDVM